MPERNTLAPVEIDELEQRLNNRDPRTAAYCWVE